jgi:hypothetical protein
MRATGRLRPRLGGKALDYRDAIRPVRALAGGLSACEAALETLAAHGRLQGEAFAGFLAAQFFQDWMAPAAHSAVAHALLPADCLAALAQRGAAQPARVARLVAQAAELREAFADAGIETLVLKGFSLGTRHYPEPERRHQWDLDLLVREDAMHDAFQVLGRLGYLARKEAADGAVVADWISRVRRGVLHRGQHSLGARRDDLRVDVHWRLGGRLADRIDHEALWSQRRAFVLQDERFETLCDEHALTLLLLGIAADLKRGACKGKQWLDLYLALRTLAPTLDWDAFLARRSRERLLRVAVNVLALLGAAWDCGEEWPGLTAALAPHRARVLLPGASDAVALIERPRGAAENKRWYARLYPRSRLHHAAWQLAEAFQGARR